MKRLLLLLLMMIGFSAFADDSYLYWMLDDKDLDWDTMYIKCGDNYLTISEHFSEPAIAVTSLSNDDYGELISYWGGLYAGVDGIAENASIVIELFNDSVKVATSESLSYSSSASYVQSGGALSPPTAEIYTFAAAAVPEPTSGVLVLIGGALLALRRKRKIVA